MGGPTETPTLPSLENVLYFDGLDANGDNALWISGGTAATTQELVGVDGIVGDVVTASDITVLGTNILFNGTDLYGNNGLWISNGTAPGTQEITGIANAASAAQGGLDPTDLTVVGNDVWFEGTDSSGNVGLWETGGTAAGTQELVPGLVASNMTVYDNEVYFTGADGGFWETNGTAAGTIEIAGTAASSLGQIDSPDTELAFAGVNNITVPGPNTFPNGFDAGSFDVVNGELLFGGTVILDNPADTATWGRLLFAWNGTSLQAIGPGPFDTGIADGTGAYSNLAYFITGEDGGQLVSDQSIVNLLLYGVPEPTDYLPNSTYGDGIIYQTDGTSAGTTYATIFGVAPGSLSAADAAGISDLTSIDGSLLYGGSAVVGAGSDLWVDSTFAPDGPADLVNGLYDPYPTNENPSGENYPNTSSDLFPDAEPSSVGSGFNPTDMTVFDGNVYFGGVNAAGETELWELLPNNPEEPFWEQTFDGRTPSITDTQTFLVASGLELTGIAGADPTGIDPSNIIALNIASPIAVAATVAELLEDEALNQTDPGSGNAPAGEGYVVVDTASDIESLTASEINSGEAIGLELIVSTDTSVVLTVAQAEALEDPVVVIAPPGDTVTVAGSAVNVGQMADTDLSELITIGVSAIATSGDLQLTMDQALALESAGIPIVQEADAAPLALAVGASAAIIEQTSAAQLGGLAAIGITAIATSGDLQLTMDQALALESAGIPIVQEAGSPPVTVTVADSAADIEPTSATLLGGLTSIGVTQIASSGDLQLNMAQGLALESAGIPIVQEAGYPPLTVTVAADATTIEQTSATLLGALSSIGVTEIATTSLLELRVLQATALDSAGVTVVQGNGAPLEVEIDDSPSQVQTLTPDEIDLLPGLSPVFVGIFSGNVTLSVDQYAAIEQNAIPLVALSLAISDTAAQIETLTSNEINSLVSYASFPVPVTDTLGSTLQFSIDQALAIVGPYYSEFGVPTIRFNTTLPSLTATISGTVAAFEGLTTAQIDALGHFFLTDISSTLTANGSLVFSAAQAEQATADNLSISVPTRDTVSIGDYAANIKGFLDLGATEVTQVLRDLNISGIAATDGSIALSVSEAEALETADANLGDTIATTAPANDTVTLSDTAGDIEGMTAVQLGGLSSIGVTAIDVTDQSITLSVAQALALYDPVPISVLPGDTVIVADTEAKIDSLTPAEIEGLAAIGVREIDVSNLTGAGPLTIDGGIRLAISGAVPSNETITFTGNGGTLALSDDVPGTDVAGTIYGYSPPDTIDLTDVPYETDGDGTAGLTTDPSDNEPALQIVENGNTYYLDIDPSQIFLTTPTFELNPDSGGTGTDLTVVEPPVTNEYFAVSFGQTSDGIVIGSGGEVEGESGAIVNRAVVQDGGELVGDVGSTINDTFIQSGGLFDLNTAAAGAGTIDFGPPVGDSIGGTLEIDDLYLATSFTITGFADGDTIDLTEDPYDPSGSADLVSGNVLDVNENNSTYTLRFDPSQNFTGDYFHLAPDSSGSGTDITEQLATLFTWTGGDDTSDLSDPDNWDALLGLPGLPGPYDIATFPTGGTVAGNLNAGVISIVGPVDYAEGNFSDAADLMVGPPSGATSGLALQPGVTGTVDGAVTVGQNGDAALSILSGSTLDSESGIVGEDSGSTGSVTIDGTGAAWIVANDLVVGDAGSGELTISDSGNLSALVEFVGLDGTGSIIQSGGTNTVGPAGTTTFVADRAFGDTFSVPAGALYVGGDGTGSYDLRDGTLSAGAINVASGSSFAFDGGTANFDTFELDSSGTVTASGDELIGTATSPDSTFIQFSGSNTIGNATNPAALLLGDAVGATGIYDLEGGSLSAADLVVGDGGTGNLAISGGTATVTDATVGVVSSGTLMLGAGGDLNATSLEVGADGSVVMAGDALGPVSVTIDASGSISGYGTISGDVSNDGELDASGGTLVVDNSVGGDSDATISGNAVLEFKSNFTEDTGFAPDAAGTLQLDQLTPDAVSTGQSSLVLNEFFPLSGIYPTLDPGAFLGEIGIFADPGITAPGPLADGQLFPTSNDFTPFTLLGTTYGGDGVTDFAIPNLQGTVLIGTGSLDGDEYELGQQSGAANVTLTSAELPTALGGTSQPFGNLQPSLAINYIINVTGDFPDFGGDGGNADQDLLGEVVPFAGNFAPAGWMFADGQLLSIAQNTGLFSILGTTYGGDGVATFALPNLQGRDIVGAGDGLIPGETVGQPTVSLSNDQVPLPNGDTVSSFDNQQPGLAMTYLIAVNGLFPQVDGSSELHPNIPYLGEIVAFAGALPEAPGGWMVAAGQLLPISQYTALFALLGTTYGGNGVTTFALPNLQGRDIVGAGAGQGNNYYEGETFGANDETINVSQLPLSPTISGFAPGDTIDLPNVAYDPSASAPTLSTDNVLGFTENGQQYSFNLDPNQYFYSATFTLAPGQGNGTDVTVAEAPVSTFLPIPPGETAYGLTVASGGTVEVQSGGALDGGTVDSGGSLNIDSGASASGVTVEDGGTQYVAPGGTANDTILTDPGTQIVAAGATVTATVDGGLQEVYGTALDTTIENSGQENVEDGGTASSSQIEATSTETVLSGGTTTDTVIAGGTLDVQSGGIVSGGVEFETTGGILQIDGAGLPVAPTLAIGGVISGFTAGDTIDLTAIAYGAPNSVGLNGADELQINEGGATYDLQFAGDYTGQTFSLSADSTNLDAGTDITDTPCYCRDTLIRTKRGQKPVQKLKIGDEVVTKSGASRPIKWIGRRSYGGRFVMGREDILPICIKAGALGDDVPKRDLWISPHHAMYLEGVLIEAKDLVNGVSIVQAERVENVEYFHIELETHDVIIAEGAPSETFLDDDSRGMFHNAHEYRTLYADAAVAPPQYCAPRRDHGYEVERARQRIALRAGLRAQDEASHLGALRGYIDLIGPRCIAGWAQNVDHPEAPVCLDIYVCGRLIGQTLANRYREDLEQAGLGSGRHSFAFTSPDGLAFAPEGVEVCRSRDGNVLALTAEAQRTLSKRLCPDAHVKAIHRGVPRQRSARIVN
jgi:T5SS/PEP-CTERM-associated repeat protein/autotransporter passenger strand-loop-strand repeat protein